MYNELLGLVSLLFILSSVVLFLKAFGKAGLQAFVVMSIILCNIQVHKMISFAGLTFTLGNVLYGSIFLATDLLCELYGKREARRAVWLGFLAMVTTLFVMLFAVEFEGIPDTAAKHDAMKELFGSFDELFSVHKSNFARTTVASLTAYLISQFHDVWAFMFWKAKTRGRHLWIRNNASTMVSQLIDSAVFCTLAFAGAENVPTPLFFEIMLTTYLVKLAIAAMDTPFCYLGRYLATRPRLLAATDLVAATE